ncbi:hypothetical protein [Streptomyces atratus]|uniref:hypothetical protein n=1 Tax=Streptomyces atratus TaxID=1893 RepID=UPI0033E3B22F
MTHNVTPRDFIADHTVERSQRPMIGGPNNFKVAIFGANVTTGQGGLNLAENTIKLGNWGESSGVAGIELVSDAEAIGRLNAAVRDRLDDDFVIVARTNGYGANGYGAAGGGVDEAIRRAQLYKA